MIFEIHNDILAVAIASKGAELQSVINKETGLEYLWSGDAKFWAKKSPVLFPIVGGLKNNSYTYKGKSHTLGRHGFARDMDFELSEQADEYIVLTLKSNTETWTKYPFDFSFSIRYSIDDNQLSTKYIVVNTGNENMFFSVGAHPAFNVPLAANTNFEDYYLQFSHIENAGRWPLSADGLIENESTPFLINTDKLPLQKSLFYNDALVFKHLRSNSITILSDITPHGLKLHFEGFPFMGIWSAKDTPFVCIEPWCGVADSVDTTGNIEEKEGINLLQPKEVFEKEWMVSLF